MTERERERESTPGQTVVFTKTAGRHNQVQVVLILAGGHVTENQSKVYARDSKALLGILFFVLRRKLFLL